MSVLRQSRPVQVALSLLLVATSWLAMEAHHHPRCVPSAAGREGPGEPWPSFHREATVHALAGDHCPACLYLALAMGVLSASVAAWIGQVAFQQGVGEPAVLSVSIFSAFLSRAPPRA